MDVDKQHYGCGQTTLWVWMKIDVDEEGHYGCEATTSDTRNDLSSRMNQALGTHMQNWQV